MGGGDAVAVGPAGWGVNGVRVTPGVRVATGDDVTSMLQAARSRQHKVGARKTHERRKMSIARIIPSGCRKILRRAGRKVHCERPCAMLHWTHADG